MTASLVDRLLARAARPYDFTDIPGLERDLREAAEALARQGEARYCAWSQEDDGGEFFDSGCGHCYMVNDADTDGMKFCVYCGDPIIFSMWACDDEDDTASPIPPVGEKP